MLLYQKVNDGKILVMEEVRLCALCCKMINLNREPHNMVFFVEHQAFLYSHKQCDTLTDLKTP